MKALMVATVANFLAGFEYNDMKLLQQLGYEVHCAANYDGIMDSRSKKLYEIGAIKHQIPFSRSPFSRNNFTAYKDLRELVLTEQFDLIHCHTPVAGIIGRLVAHKCKVPKVIYTAHGFHFYTGAPLKNWIMYYPVEKWCSRYTDYLITINKEDFKRASEKLHAKKTVYVPGVGVDTKKFTTGDRGRIRKELGIDDSEFMLLSVGELNQNKNHESVIRAAEGLDLVYVIAGKGELEDHLKIVASEKGVKLILAGYRTDIVDFYAAADAYILPSVREGLNVSLMEAMASGLPCLCGRIRGNVDLVDETIGGYLFNPANIAEIKDVMRKMIGLSLEERKKVGQHNIEKIKGFDRKVVVDLMIGQHGPYNDG